MKSWLQNTTSQKELINEGLRKYPRSKDWRKMIGKKKRAELRKTID